MDTDRYFCRVFFGVWSALLLLLLATLAAVLL